VIHRQRASKRSFQPESEAHGIGPMRPEVCFIYRCQKISRWNGSRIFLAKHFTNAPEHIAAIVKRDNLHRSRERYSCFKIHYCQCITTHRNSKRIQKHDFLIRIPKRTQRNNDLTWSSLFKTKPAQRRRTAGEETLADR